MMDRSRKQKYNTIIIEEQNYLVKPGPIDTDFEIEEPPKTMQTPTHPVPDYYDSSNLQVNTLTTTTILNNKPTSTINPIATKATVKPSSTTLSEDVSSSNNPKLSTNTIVIGVSCIALLLLMVLLAFLFHRKRKNNNKNAGQTDLNKEVGSVKTDKHLTLPFTGINDISQSMTSEVSESAFYKNNSALLGNGIMQDSSLRYSDFSEIVYKNTPEIKGNQEVKTNTQRDFKNNIYEDSYRKPSEKRMTNESNNYRIDINIETPTMDIAFPKPTFRSSLSSIQLPGDSENNSDIAFNKETSQNVKPKYITNNPISSPEKSLTTEEISRIDNDILLKKEQEKIKEEKLNSEEDQGQETMTENVRLQTPESMTGSNDKLNNTELSSSDGVIRHSPQTLLTPRKSILKKGNKPRSYSASTPTRNPSIKIATIDCGTSTLPRNKNSNSNLSVDNVSGQGSLASGEDDIGSLPSIGGIGRTNTINTVNSVTTTTSNMTGVRLPPVLSAFHHALPTPPTPKSTKFFGPDGELLPGQVINEKLMVPDVLNDAMVRHDIQLKQDGINYPNSYCTLRRQMNKSHEHDDTSSKQDTDNKDTDQSGNSIQNNKVNYPFDDEEYNRNLGNLFHLVLIVYHVLP